MTNFKTFLIILFCISLIGCKKKSTSGLIEFDINTNYPVKTLNLEDVADIEYLVLDISDDDYLFSSVRTISDNYFIYSRNSS